MQLPLLRNSSFNLLYCQFVVHCTAKKRKLWIFFFTLFICVILKAIWSLDDPKDQFNQISKDHLVRCIIHMYAHVMRMMWT